MAQSKKSQLLTLSLIATLLSFTPLLSSSFRSTYLYFIINVLIVVLGAEAGFLSPSPSSSSSSSSSNKNVELVEKKNTNNINTTTKEGVINARIVRVIEEEDDNNNSNIVASENNFTSVEKSVPEKIIVCATEVSKMIKKCPSIPSIFFINEDEDEDEDVQLTQEDDEQENNNNNNGDFEEEEEEEEELFEKAETFIVNFYKQLKMQREESWKNLSKFNADNRLLVN